MTADEYGTMVLDNTFIDPEFVDQYKATVAKLKKDS